MKQVKDGTLQTADGSIIHLTETGIWCDVSTHMSFDEFDELKDYVHDYAENRRPIDWYYLANVFHELSQRFGNQVQAVKVIGRVSTAVPFARYDVTIMDSRDGLLYDCSTRGQYKEVLQRLPVWIR